MELPAEVRNTKVNNNVENKDGKGPDWIFLGAKHPAADEPQRVSKCKAREKVFNFDWVEFFMELQGQV